jgi:hypothetical protein
VLTTCQPSTVWCSRGRLPAAAAQPAKVRQSCSATDYYYYPEGNVYGFGVADTSGIVLVLLAFLSAASWYSKTTLTSPGKARLSCRLLVLSHLPLHVC